MTSYRLLIVALAAFAAAPAFANPDLAKTKNCMGCHAIDKKLVGPGFKEIAAKYAGQKGMDAKLAAKIIHGGSGAWGTMPMPPNAVSEQEAATLAKWVLAQK
ncbi:c-type cytochrome [Pseudoduganella sp. GCM10020061]|uniref:c-type cytochrome n=1 Tax=Pseudoduganella sp. GCM10020061 TaxID=3317345 RepID=UPI003633B4D9